MPHGLQKVDVKKCDTKKRPPHPCDPPIPCDPKDLGDDCEKPYICQERIKNPAWPGEVTTCKSGSYMDVKSCAKVHPPHPCDKKPPCSLKSSHEKNKKLPCMYDTPLCFERIKNPEDRKKEDPSCDPTK